jgi:hypothetical protein
MYLPPNSAANAAFLETLRSLVVHETPGALELGFATPRWWLAVGNLTTVQTMPTRFGPVSYSLQAVEREVYGSADLPPRAKNVRLRVRLPAGSRITSVVVDGTRLPAQETIDLSGRSGSVDIRVGYLPRSS